MDHLPYNLLLKWAVTIGQKPMMPPPKRRILQDCLKNKNEIARLQDFVKDLYLNLASVNYCAAAAAGIICWNINWSR
jgi:hypothetical protein